MLTISKNSEGFTIIVKGAFEKIIELCTFYHSQNESLFLSPNAKRLFEELNTQLARRGERIIAYAKLTLMELPLELDYEKKNFPMSNYTFVGMVSLVDPPRPSIPEAIRKCS